MYIFFKNSDIRVHEIPRGKSVLEIAEEEGITIKNICRKGLCGMCKINKLEGEVSMILPFALKETEKKKGVILSCLAHPRTDVVLDL